MSSPDALAIVYLGSILLAGLVAFWDSPVRLFRAYRQGHLLESRRYHLLNATSLVAIAAWLTATITGADIAFLPADPGWAIALRVLGLAGAWVGLSLAIWARLLMGDVFAPTSVVYQGQGVVTQGPFAHIRHPFYAGMWLAVAAGTLAMDSLATLALATVLVPILRSLARMEEAHLANVLGGSYDAYAERVPRFIPGMRPRPPGR